MTQTEALNILTTGANVFLTGEPGSGKTHTIQQYVSWLRSHGIEPAITASTGIAATHIGGMTLHSWSGIGVREYLSPMDLDAIISKEHVVRRIQKTGVLIIDEISMLSADVLTMVDQVVRAARRDTRAFGGLQVVMVGDFFQLPPISKSGTEALFAFESPSWQSLNPLVLYLHEQHRQEDAKFVSLLQNIRRGTFDVSDSSSVISREVDEDGVGADIPRLYTHNADVDKENNDMLGKLSSQPKTFSMEESGPPVLVDALKRGCLSPEQLHLKENAVVMFTKNNPLAGYHNGTLGTVIDFERGTGYPVILLRDGREVVAAPQEWVVEQEGKIRAKIIQIPLKLAWALTIHKSQGQSLDAAAIDLRRAFEYGQGYVALSRLRTLGGLHLLGWSEEALAIHPKVTEVDALFKEASEDAARVFGELETSGERRTLVTQFIRALGGTLEAKAAGERPEKKSTYQKTLDLITLGKSLKDIARERSVTFGTIATHIETLVKEGLLSTDTVHALLPEKLILGLPSIFEAFDSEGEEKLTPVFGKLKKRYTFDELKLARALYTAEHT